VISFIEKIIFKDVESRIHWYQDVKFLSENNFQRNFIFKISVQFPNKDFRSESRKLVDKHSIIADTICIQNRCPSIKYQLTKYLIE